MPVEILLHSHNVVGYPKKGTPRSLWTSLIAVTYYATYCTNVDCTFDGTCIFESVLWTSLTATTKSIDKGPAYEIVLWTLLNVTK